MVCALILLWVVRGWFGFGFVFELACFRCSYDLVLVLWFCWL